MVGHIEVICVCSLLFDDIKILARYASKTAKKIGEVVFLFSFIDSYDAGLCVSAPSVVLADDEVEFNTKSGRFVYSCVGMMGEVCYQFFFVFVSGLFSIIFTCCIEQKYNFSCK